MSSPNPASLPGFSCLACSRAGIDPVQQRKHEQRLARVRAENAFEAIALEWHEALFRPDVIECQLAHEKRNKVRAAYHRAEYLDDRRKMMQWWANYLDQQRAIGLGDNVVSLTRKG